MKLIRLFILLALVPAFSWGQGTPLSGIPVGTPARTSKVVGHTVTGQPRQFTIGSLVDVYNVRHFGAVGDGVADDTAAIAATFAAAPAGATVFFPAGTYLMTNYVTLGADRVTVTGFGAKITSNASGQDRKFSVIGRTGIKFIGLQVDGGGLTQENMTAPEGFPPPEHPDWVFPGFDTYSPRNRPGTIHFKDSSECLVSLCRFDGVNWPVTILGDCSLIKIDSCTFAGYYAAVYSYFSDDASPHNEDAGGHPQPRRISVTNNDFLPGKYRSFDFYNAYGVYGDRDYTFNDKGCSGAIKFRGSGDAASKPWMVAAQHVITGNNIRDPGMMGIELQGCANDSLVANNNISSVPFGVSLSTLSRMVVTGNVIKDTIYASVECEGWLDGTDPNNDGILISGNMMEGRDDYGRPVNWVDNFGIVVDDHCRNVVISDNVIKYHRTGVAVKGGSYNVKISNLRIVTNEQSGNGGIGPYAPGPWTDNFVQGIIVKDAHDVDISDCSLAPTLAAWCRMINLYNAQRVTIRNSTIESNNTGVYIHGSSSVLVDGNVFRAGVSPGGLSPAFIFVDSSPADCANLSIKNNKFIGALANGISVYVPSHVVGPLHVEGNDTREVTVANPRFFDIGVSGTGVVGAVIARNNLGGVTESSSIEVPYKTVVGTDGPFQDRAAYQTLLCLYQTTINLQASAWAGQRKTIVLTTQHAVTINPASGETINGSSAPVGLSHQWDRVQLESDGAGNWTVVSASPTASLPIGVAVVKQSLAVDAGGYGTPLRQIASAVVTHDFGTIAAGAEATHGFTVRCATGTTNTPILVPGFTSYFHPGLVVRTYIDSTDHGTIRIYNPTASPITVGSLTFRALVIEPVAP